MLNLTVFFFVLLFVNLSSAQSKDECGPEVDLSERFGKETPKLSEIKSLHPAISDWAAVKLRREADSTCKHPVKLPSNARAVLKQYGVLPLDKRKEGALEIMEPLMRHPPRPLNIGYNACVLLNTCKKPKEFLPHSSTVVGKRWNPVKKRCEVKIRNSWGASCKNINPDTECDKGYWWISTESLAANVFTSVWIEK